MKNQQILSLLIKAKEIFTSKKTEEKKYTAIFMRTLETEKLIKDFCYKTGRATAPAEWLTFSNDIVRYDTHNSEEKKHPETNFGKQFLENAEKNFPPLYKFFSDRKEQLILNDLESLLKDIRLELQNCSAKLPPRYTS